MLTRASILLMNCEKVAFRRCRSESHLRSSFSMASFTCIQETTCQGAVQEQISESGAWCS